MRDWRKDFGTNKNSRDAWHLVFSINERVSDERNLRALQKSVEQTLSNNFYGHKYALIMHTHQNNPHIHVVLNKRDDFSKKKIHFNTRSEIKEFFDDVRTNFANSLRLHGLNYENKNSLQKDLKSEFNRIKRSVKLETEDYTAKDFVSEYYFKLQEKNQEMHKNLTRKIEQSYNELNVLKGREDELWHYLLDLKKRKSKYYYKIAKEYKAQRQVCDKKRKDILADIKKVDYLSYQAIQINKMHLDNFKDRSSGLVLLENFTYNYKQIFNKTSPLKASKSDWLNYHKARRAIAIHRNRNDELAKKYFDDSLIATRLLGRNESLFALDKKLEILDKNLYILNHSELGDDDKNAFKKRLNENKEFINNIANKRFEFVANKLLKAESLNPNDFLFKEYFKGVDLLGIKLDERILRAKNKPYVEILKDKGVEISKSHTAIKTNSTKNERGVGR
ncbi:relaxase/mobilization nuclease domain-containing protein [Campylobacter gastrosuis]|uniref:Relaxase n=1 Tax=Campylobacter gastrosuis TaxID=2974576 RepID=A0ABT7HSS7_9BACT|nr:relaxase [Campylobacter gastrosuis]MDL0089986.1 relaxase [Campylobacter gastrosuis]